MSALMSVVDRLAERTVRRTFERADVVVGGTRPWDLHVHDRSFYTRLARNPAFQLGETYTAGLWDCDAIDELLERLVNSKVVAAHDRSGAFFLRSAWARVTNRQSRARAGQVATAHYDLDAELYRSMLEETLTYTCAYWDGARTLDEAQRAKLALICDKLELGPGDTLLDIGCGFGGLAAFAAEHYGARVTGITNSRLHHELAREHHGDRADFELLDYRDLPGLGRRFTKIASIEMIEAVGPKNLGTFMAIAHGMLAPGGRFLVQSFISPANRQVCNEWFDRYIFPNGVSPSLNQLARATASNFGAPAAVHDLGSHYAPTLLAWDANLTSAWPRLTHRYDRRFRRTWHFYLRSLAGVFRSGDLRLCQLGYTRS